MSTTAANDPWRDKEKMIEKFAEGLSQVQMAEEWGCSQDTISRWKNRHGIDMNQSHRSGQHSDIPYFRTKETGYEVVGSWNGDRGCSDRVYIHRLLAYLEVGLEGLEDMYVHHKNRIPWDNRPENIEVMTAEEHGSIHGGDWP